MTKLTVRCNGLFTKTNELYLLKNPFTGAWEIIADTAETPEGFYARDAHRPAR